MTTKTAQSKIKKVLSNIGGVYLRIDNYNKKLIFAKKKYGGAIGIYPSPSGNCQLAMLYKARNLKDLNKYYIFLFITFYYIKTRKPIMMMDIKENVLKVLKKKLKPYYNKFHIKRYKSTNGSDMVVCLVYLKVRLLRKLTFDDPEHTLSRYINKIM